MAIEFDIYLREKGGEWLYQGTTDNKYWNVSSYVFDDGKKYEWRVDVYDTETDLTTTGDTWAFTTSPIFTFTTPLTGASPRDVGDTEYEPDKSWQFVDGEYRWVDLPDVKGGGKYQNQLVIISVDENGKGNLSYV